MPKIIKEARRKINLNPLEKWSQREDFWGNILYTIGLKRTTKNRNAIKKAVQQKTGRLLYGRDYSWLKAWARRRKKRKTGRSKKRNRQIGLDGIFIWRFRKYNNAKVWNISKPTKGLKSNSTWKGRHFCDPKGVSECGPGFHFETFYDEIRKCFGDKWQDSVLKERGMDYKFGPEHAAALADLLAAKKKGCSTQTGEPPESVKKKNCEPSGGKWDGENCICPEGKVLDKATGKCVDKKKVRNNEIFQKQCENSGGKWDVATQTCKCPEGKVYNKKNGYCEDPNKRKKTPREKSELDPSGRESDVTDEEKSMFATKPSLPDLVLLKKGGTGEIVIVYGENDPLGKRSKKVFGADGKTKAWFGTGILEYLKANKSDTQRPMTVKRADGTEVKVRDDREYKRKYGGFKEGDKVTSAATYHPIHVMFAAEEFIPLVKADDYEWVFIKKDADTEEMGKKAINIAEQRMAFWGTTGAAKAETGGIDRDKAGMGTFRIGMTHPPEGLDNKQMLIEKFDEYVHSSTGAWKSLATMPPPVDTDGKALQPLGPVKTTGAGTLPHMRHLPKPTKGMSEEEWRTYVFKLLLPKGWREGKVLTDAENLLAKRVGAKLSGETVDIIDGWPSWIPKKYKDPTFWPCDKGWPPMPSLSYAQAKDDPEKLKKYKVELFRRLRWQCECQAKGKWDAKTNRCKLPPRKMTALKKKWPVPTGEKGEMPVKLPAERTVGENKRERGLQLSVKDTNNLWRVFPNAAPSKLVITPGVNDEEKQKVRLFKKFQLNVLQIAKRVKLLINEKRKGRVPGTKGFNQKIPKDQLAFKSRKEWEQYRQGLYRKWTKELVNKIYKALFPKAGKTKKQENLNLIDLRDIIRERVQEIEVENIFQDGEHLEEELDLEEEFLEET